MKKEKHFQKYQFLIFGIILIMISCQSKKKPDVTVNDINIPVTAEGIDKARLEKMPKISFDKTVYDFGNVMQGESLGCVFNYTNIGKSNLIISSADASCGCTVPDYTKTPIKPGEQGVVKIKFNTENKKGEVTNTVKVYGNTYPSYTVLTIKANVIKP